MSIFLAIPIFVFVVVFGIYISHKISNKLVSPIYEIIKTSEGQYCIKVHNYIFDHRINSYFLEEKQDHVYLTVGNATLVGEIFVTKMFSSEKEAIDNLTQLTNNNFVLK